MKSHIHLVSSLIFFLIIIFFSIVFIFSLLIPFSNESYVKYSLSNKIYNNICPLAWGYFAVFYRNEMKIEKHGLIRNVNTGHVKTIVTCRYNDIQSSQNKSCGNLKGIHNINRLIEQFNQIDQLSHLIWIFSIVLILINFIILISIGKLLLPSTSRYISKQVVEIKFKKRLFLYNYFKFLFIPLLIPASFIATYYNSLSNILPTRKGIVDSYYGDSNSFFIVSIIFICIGIVTIFASLIPPIPPKQFNQNIIIPDDSFQNNEMNIQSENNLNNITLGVVSDA